MTSRPSTAAPILAVLAIVLVMLGAYVGGYFWLGEFMLYTDLPERGERPLGIERTYQYLWQKKVFQPAARVETYLRGLDVQTLHRWP